MKLLGLTLLRLWLPVMLIAAWWFGSANSTSLYFPPLSQIVETLRADWLGPYFVEHLLPSIGKFASGYLIAVVLGVVIGLILGMSQRIRAITDPFVQFFRSLPPPVIIPIGILVFGIGVMMNIFIIVFGAIWATLLNTTDGIAGVHSQVRDMARSYRLGFWQRVRHVLLPAAAPQIAAGMRTSLQISIILIVVSEMVGATSGIGYYVIKSQQTFQITETWAGTIVLGVLGYLAALIFMLIEKRVLRWHAGMLASQNAE